jgi:hypothetical protein
MPAQLHNRDSGRNKGFRDPRSMPEKMTIFCQIAKPGFVATAQRFFLAWDPV